MKNFVIFVILFGFTNATLAQDIPTLKEMKSISDKVKTEAKNEILSKFKKAFIEKMKADALDGCHLTLMKVDFNEKILDPFIKELKLAGYDVWLAGGIRTGFESPTYLYVSWNN